MTNNQASPLPPLQAIPKHRAGPLEDFAVLDIESNGLLETVDTFYCAVLITSNGEVSRFSPDELNQLSDKLLDLDSQGVPVVGHNVIAYDIPALKILSKGRLPKSYPETLPLDTLTLSHLVTPDLLNLTMSQRPKWRRTTPREHWTSHSLKAWGYRLGELKHEPPSFDTYTPETLDYCEQDVRVTLRLLEELTSERWLTSWSAVWLEMQVAWCINEQVTRGVCFDVSSAEKLAVKLLDEVDKLRAKVATQFPRYLKKEFIAKVGNKRFNRKRGDLVQHWEDFNPGSNKHLEHYLRTTYDWEPLVLTDKGNPKLDDDVVEDLARFYGELELIRQYRVANKILSYLSTGDNAWLKLQRGNRLHGNVKSCGAGTRRMTHNNPNLGNVPSVRAYLGAECRSLFGPTKGLTLGGVDADQLELRSLAHYLAPYDGGAYVNSALYGSKEDGTDIHSINARVFGTSRDDGKTVFYSWLYGAGPATIGRNITKSWDTKKNTRVGLGINRKMEQNLSSLVRLKADLVAANKSRGHLLDLDGQKFRVRRNHSILNELNQRAGAILMKRFLVETWNRLSEAGARAALVLSVHDEYQWELTPEYTQVFEAACKESWETTTAAYSMRIPIEGTPAFGETWKETH